MLVEGIVGGTTVATTVGWRPVERIREGDALLGADGRSRVVELVRHSPIRPSGWPASLVPLLVPAGALANREDLVLLSGQLVLLETGPVDAVMGERSVLVPAAALDGFGGIARVRPVDGSVVVSLGFARDELILASGALLLRCPGSGVASDPLRAMRARAARGCPPALSLEQAVALVACLVAAEAGSGLRGAGVYAARDWGENLP